MTSKEQQPLAGSVETRQGVTKMPLGLLFLLVLGLIIALVPLWTTSARILRALADAGWNTVVNPNYFAIACLSHPECTVAYNEALIANYPYVWLLPLVAAFIIFAVKSKPQEYAVKQPGMAWWAQAEDKGIEEYLSHGKGDNRLLGYLGHLMSVGRDGKIDYKLTVPLYVRQNALSENVLVLGGVGAGKTRGYFRPLIMLAAHLGFSIIVIDLKYPQADSGFFDMIGYWKKKGRDVMLFTPFSDNTMRLPLLDSVTDYASALSMASTVMPPPEFGPEPGKHYRDRDRGVLAAFILAVAQSDNASFAELLRYACFTPEEMKRWFDRQVDLNSHSEIVENLKGTFAQGDKEVAAVLQGIKNALKIFYDPRVARATQSLEGENMDVRAAFRKPTMLYIGIQQEYMLEGQGVILLQLAKRYIDLMIMKEAEAQGGRFKRHVAYILDEFPALGQLAYMMRSLGTLRSYNVSHHLGFQTFAQLAVVYGKDLAEAMTTNVIGRRVFFPRAIDSKERQTISEQIGNTTVWDFSETDSRKAFMGTQLDEATRSGVSMKQIAVPLLPPEEFPHFRPMEAVISSRGVNPIRTFMPAIEEEYLDGPDIPKGVKNGLYALYKQVNPEREDMGKYTTRLIQSGAFGVRHQQSVVTDAETKLADVIGMWLSSSEIKFVRSGQNRERLYIEWLRDRTPEEQQQVERLYAREYLAQLSGSRLRLTPKAISALPSTLQTEVDNAALLGVLDLWLASHKEATEGTPERDALPEDQRPEPEAILRDKKVLLRFTVMKDLFGYAPMPLMKRVGKAQYIEVNRDEPHALLEILQSEAAKNQDNADNPLANAVSTLKDTQDMNGEPTIGSASDSASASPIEPPLSSWEEETEDEQLARSALASRQPTQFEDVLADTDTEPQDDPFGHLSEQLDYEHQLHQ